MLKKVSIIRRLDDNKYRLYSKKRGPDGKRKNLGTFESLEQAQKRERQVDYFKHQEDSADDTDDKESKALSKLSDIAQYMEEAGMVDKAKEIYNAMYLIDNSLEDNLVDPSIIPDEQFNVENQGYVGGDGTAGSYSLFNIPEAHSVMANHILLLVKVANSLDKKGAYEEADELDEIIRKMMEDEESVGKEIEMMSGDYEDEEKEKEYKKHEEVTDPEEVEKKLMDRKMKKKDIQFDVGGEEDWDTWNPKSVEQLEEDTHIPAYDDPQGVERFNPKDPGDMWFQGLEGEYPGKTDFGESPRGYCDNCGATDGFYKDDGGQARCINCGK